MYATKTGFRQLTGSIGLFALLWLCGLYLRIPVLAAPALATRVARDLELTQIGVGALTLLPILMLAIGAAPGAWLLQRLGTKRTLIVSMLVLAGMSAWRGIAPTPLWFFLATAAMGLGIATLQTALPSAVVRWVPSKVALGSAIYLNGMVVGELAGAGLTLPVVLPIAGGEWRTAFLLWSLPVVAIIALLFLPADDEEQKNRAPQSWMPDWLDAQTWQLGGILAMSCAVFLAINAYMGSILAARGEAARLDDLLFLFNSMPLLASITVLLLNDRLKVRIKPIVLSMLMSVVGLTGFMVLAGWGGMLSAVLAGYSATLLLILVMGLVPLLREGNSLNRLTAGVLTIGYIVTFALSLAGGALSDISGSAIGSLLPVLLFSLASFALIPGLLDPPRHEQEMRV